MLAIIAISAKAKRFRGNICQKVCGDTLEQQYTAQCGACVTNLSIKHFCEHIDSFGYDKMVIGCEDVVSENWARPDVKTWIEEKFRRKDGTIIDGTPGTSSLNIQDNFLTNSKEKTKFFIDTRYDNGPTDCHHPPCHALGLAYRRAHPWTLWNGGQTPLDEQREDRIEGAHEAGELKGFRYGQNGYSESGSP